MKSDRKFCPCAIVLVDGRPLVFRFYNAFKNAKHGNREGLQKLETAFFSAISPQVGGDFNRSGIR
jgi:hypothetical protein